MKIIYYILLFLVSFIYGSLETYASPATPRPVVYRQPSGKTLQVYLRGDEHYHFYESKEGRILMPDAQSRLCYAVYDKECGVVAGDIEALPVESLQQEEAIQVKAIDQHLLRQQLRERFCDNSGRRALVSVKPGGIENAFPTQGNIRGLVLLVQFTDKKFSRDDIRDVFDEMVNDSLYDGPYATGSVKRYFSDQSKGTFVPTFDVVGPIDLPHDMAYYGQDERADLMIMDACDIANTEKGVDFSPYDFNSDGYVDFVFVVFAGYGQAQGGGEETVWPQAVDLSYKSWTLYNELYLSQAACSSELQGASGDTIDGIGTFCHEFSHILGLPDIYDPLYSGMPGMLNWDIMDLGLYNNSGRTPSGYTAMDKYSVGWLQPTVLTESSSDVVLKPLGESNDAYFIVCPEDSNEYFTLENRQQTGWDSGLGGHGLIISHICYDPSLWKSNRVNTNSSSFEHVELMAADNEKTAATTAGDPFGANGGQNAFSSTTVPAAKWRNSAESLDNLLTNIREENGNIVFNYRVLSDEVKSLKVASPVIITVEDGGCRIENQVGEEVRICDIAGKTVVSTQQQSLHVKLASGIYIAKWNGGSSKFIVR